MTSEPTTQLPAPLRIARFFMTRPWAGLLCIVLLLATAGLGLSQLQLRSDGAAIYPDDDPTVVRTRSDGERFGESEQIILLLTSRSEGPALASRQGLTYLKEVHRALTELAPKGARSLRSLADLPTPPESRGDSVFESYLSDIPEEPSELAALIDRIRRHPLADGLFLSSDGSAAAFYLPLDPSEPRDALANRLRTWIASQSEAGFDMRLTGPVIAETQLGDSVIRDLTWLAPAMLLAVVVLLIFSIATVGGVLVTLTELALVVACTLGAMGLAGVPVTLVTSILPVVLMATAVIDEIHLLERLQGYLSALPRRKVDAAAMREAVAASLKDIQSPLILTSLTTSIAFLSFLSASIAPVRHFGVFTALGILLAMASTFTLIPALILRLPPRWFIRTWQAPSLTASLPAAQDRLLARNHRWNFALGLIAVALLAPGLSRLSVQDSWIDNFSPESDLVTGERIFNDRFWGSYRFDLVLESSRPGFFLSPEGLAAAERIEAAALGAPHAGGAISYLTPFRILASGWGQEAALAGLPPADLEEMRQGIEELGTRINFRHYLDPEARRARLRIFVRDPDYQQGKDLERYLEQALPPLVQEAQLQFHFSGDLPTAVATVQAIVLSQLRSIGWTVVGVVLVLCLALRSLPRGLIVASPVLAAACIVLGAMGYLGLPLGIATSMFSALTIGVGVDFALHFWHRYWEERKAGRMHPLAFLTTLRSVGRAMRWNAAVLAFGFLVLTLSDLNPNRSLGFLLAAAMGASYCATLLLLPYLCRASGGGAAPLKRPQGAFAPALGDASRPGSSGR